MAGGEKAKSSGEYGEQIVKNILDMMGWNNANSGVTVPCVHKEKHKRENSKESQKHGIDYVYTYKSQLRDATKQDVLVTMILRCIDVKTKTNDLISLVMYFAVLGLWIFIVKTKRFMGLKAERFLIAFNNNAPSLIIVSSLLFYSVVCTCTCRYIWIAVIVLTFLGCMLLTYLWYKREKIYMHM